MRILVIKLSSLGDIFHALPAAAELAAQLSAEVDWAVQPAFSPIVRTFSCVRDVYEVPRPSHPFAYLSAIRRLRRKRYDCVVDFQGLLKSAFVARFIRAERCIGPSFAREGSCFFYTESAGKLNKNRHAVDECFDVLRYLELSVPKFPRFPITVPLIDLNAMAPLFSTGPRIALAPMSRWESKNWPAEHFSELLKRLVVEHHARVYLIGGAGDHSVSEAIIAAAGVEAANLCGRLSLSDSLGVLVHCEALVSNDSGPMHMAAALGVKCVVPFGPTAPERTGPYGKIHITLRSEAACAPCYKRTCPIGTQACMHDVTPKQVEQALFD